MQLTGNSRAYRRFRTWCAAFLLISLLLGGCFFNEKVEPFYGRIVVPTAQEFKWSDGGLPQIFDPAFAAAPPDTDVVRAIFEGLTDYDPKTLAPVPGVANRWEASNGGRQWTFYLRDDARWSNGEPVTAPDFVRSWRRLARIGDLAPHTQLLANIEGAEKRAQPTPPPAVPANARRARQPQPQPRDQPFGVEALSDRVLRVRLRRPDLNFPALVSHPVFRPVKLNDSQTSRIAPEELVSNGPFTLTNRENQRVLLERANHYWDKQQVTLERVAFVGQKDAESALAAYRAGEVDAVTNAAFEPLAIKLLAPYEDFRRATYSALTYYSFNSNREPFDDVRVREALALAFDRERISKDDLGGLTEPATRFLPGTIDGAQTPVVEKSQLLEKDYERARDLLAEAGYPDGEGFPRVQLLINRNEQQRIVAQAIADMWRTVLNIETDIIIKNWDEYEADIRMGNYDVVRRGMVMQTTDELTNIRALFQENLAPSTAEAPASAPNGSQLKPTVETESQALNDLSSMPIYFASAYALVKPYVAGFDANVLDAPSLKNVRINTNWKPTESQPAGK